MGPSPRRCAAPLLLVEGQQEALYQVAKPESSKDHVVSSRPLLSSPCQAAFLAEEELCVRQNLQSLDPSTAGTKMMSLSPDAPEKSCACTGIRFCARCRDPEFRRQHGMHAAQEACYGRRVLRYDPETMLAGISTMVGRPNVGDEENISVVVPPDGLELIPNFLTECEEVELNVCDSVLPWVSSQSGRRKCDFGPAFNYNKRKMKIPNQYVGVPEELLSCRAFVKLRRLFEQRRFSPAGWFFQEYRGEESSNFAPHIDHAWSWGDRIFDLNLLEDSVLSFFEVAPSEEVVAETESSRPSNTETTSRTTSSRELLRVDVPLPRRALLLFSGPARYDWEHGILEGAIKRRRISLTVRELSSELADTEVGRQIVDLACTAFVSEPAP